MHIQLYGMEMLLLLIWGTTLISLSPYLTLNSTSFMNVPQKYIILLTLHIQFDGSRGWHGNVVIGSLTGQDGMEVGAAQLTQPQLVGHPPGGHINVLADVIKECVISPPCHPGGWSTWKSQILVLSMWDKDEFYHQHCNYSYTYLQKFRQNGIFIGKMWE